MAIKVFRAADLRQALTQMEMELGTGATIILQRQVPASRWWPFGRKQWEVLASDQPERAEPRYVPDAGRAQLEAEVAELRADLSTLVRSANLTRLPRCGKVLVECYEHLCSKGLPPELAQALVLGARDELSHTAQGQPEVVWPAVRRQLEQGLRTRAPKVLSGSGPLVILLFGQTGVGKTTTLAKLAARQALTEGVRVAIINMDILRPAAQQQLEALAASLNITVETTPTVDGFRDALLRHACCDVIFVDTSGTGRLDHRQLEQLAGLARLAPRRQAFLVLNAAGSLEELMQTVRGFRPLGLDGIILSKVDETDAMGAAISMAHQCSTPIAYLTNGRRIPDDILAATPEVLSATLLPGTVAKLPATAKAAPAARPARKAKGAKAARAATVKPVAASAEAVNL